MPQFELAWLPKEIWFAFVQFAERNRVVRDNDTFEQFLLDLLLANYRLEACTEDVATGGPGDCFIDGIIVTINGKHIDTKASYYALHGEDIRDFQIEFIQITSERRLDPKKLEDLSRGCVYFLENDSKLPENDRVAKKRGLKNFLAGSLNDRDPGVFPNIVLTYIWPGNQTRADIDKAAAVEKGLNKHFPQQRAAVKLFDAEDISLLVSNKAICNFGKLNRHSLVFCPAVEGAEATFIGYASVREICNLVCHPKDKLRINYSVFYDNVRSFLGWTDVNRSIDTTLKDTVRQSEFLLRNNGITITSKSFELSGDSLCIRDFQIVNGCQTCSVIVKNVDSLSDNCFLPVKIICSADSDVVDRAIEGANKQNAIGEFAFLSRHPFVRRLEQHCRSLQGSENSIYLERQENQWAGGISTGAVSRDRVVGLMPLLRSVATLAREPHQVQAGGTAEFMRWITRRELLDAGHSLEVYHLAGQALCHCRARMGFTQWDRFGAKAHAVYSVLRLTECKADIQLNLQTSDYHIRQARGLINSDAGRQLIQQAFKAVSAAHAEFMPSKQLSEAARQQGFTLALKKQLRTSCGTVN